MSVPYPSCMSQGNPDDGSVATIVETALRDGMLRCINKLDVESAVEDLINGKVTPEQVANDLESVTTVVGRVMQSVTYLALSSDNEEEDFIVRQTQEFNKDLNSNLRKKIKEEREVSTISLLKQTVDEVCEAWVDKLDKLFDWENGAFLRYCPVYGVESTDYDELELQIPCRCCCEKYYQFSEDPLMKTLQNVANRSHDAKLMCWQCKVYCEPRKCSECEVARYCTKSCQLVAWQEGHKRKCKHLWDRYNGFKESLESVHPMMNLSSTKSIQMRREIKKNAFVDLMENHHK